MKFYKLSKNILNLSKIFSEINIKRKIVDRKTELLLINQALNLPTQPLNNLVLMSNTLKKEQKLSKSKFLILK